MAKIEKSMVYLEPIEHVYIHRESGKRFTSVTKVLSSIEPHFEGDRIAGNIAKQSDSNPKKNPAYIGMNKEQILDYWQELNDTANIYGTMVHEIVERYLLANKMYFTSDPFELKVIKAYEDLEVDEGIEIYPERIMFSEEYELAGTADLKIDINETYFDIGDWKGLPIDTPIFTNNGWKTMASLSHGDKVYDMDGKLCDILHFSEIKNKDCFEIEFDNGEVIISDHEHRWLVSFMRSGNLTDKVMTSEELFEHTNKLGTKRWSYKIPKVKICKALDNQHIDLPLDPYLLGVWLCDGDKDITKTIIVDENVWLELNLVNDKRIPDTFFMSSYEQRVGLLRGFMDVNGHYNKSRKRFVMSTTIEWQGNEFNKLASSLGIKTTVIKYNKKVNGEIVDVIDICFSTDNLNPFLSKEVLNVEYNNKTFKNIIRVSKVESVPTRCIEVGSLTSTFLYGFSFSVTHNTNKEFNFFNKFGYKTLNKPFDHLQDCQYSIYSMQLSTYALMCEMETGMKCRQIWIGYWDKVNEVFEKIPVMYLKSDAKKLLDIHKYTQLYK